LHLLEQFYSLGSEGKDILVLALSLSTDLHIQDVENKTEQTKTTDACKNITEGDILENIVRLPEDLIHAIESGRRLKDHLVVNRPETDPMGRINAFLIHIPPLRERPQDIPLLAAHFLEKNPGPSTSPRHPGWPTVPWRVSLVMVGRAMSGNLRISSNAP
jgi:hypothetical protein